MCFLFELSVCLSKFFEKLLYINGRDISNSSAESVQGPDGQRILDSWPKSLRALRAVQTIFRKSLTHRTQALKTFKTFATLQSRPRGFNGGGREGGDGAVCKNLTISIDP